MIVVGTKRRLLLLVAISIITICFSPAISLGQIEAGRVNKTSPAEKEVRPRHGWGHRILLYIPNRIADVIDIFRIRARLGPGLAVNLRATELANVYAGTYHTVFAGLPGPRGKPELRAPVGIEQERGLLVMGVDATDDLTHEPGYSSTEIDLGVQVLLVGAEAGFALVEIGDFLAGLLFFDPMRDDF